MTVLFKPILALNVINFSSCQNYWGGAKTICLPPNIFIGGGGGAIALPPPPPQDRRLCPLARRVPRAMISSPSLGFTRERK